MAVGEVENVGRWGKMVTVPGGRMAFCRLCGRRFRKSFMTAGGDEDEALRAASAYIGEHMASPAHRAALNAYFADIPPLGKQEAWAYEIWGQSPPNERQRRREIARRAAEKCQRSLSAPSPR